jgi:hypothetical protein
VLIRLLLRLVALWLRLVTLGCALVALGYAWLRFGSALVGVVRLLIVRFIGFLMIVDNIDLIDSVVFRSCEP